MAESRQTIQLKKGSFRNDGLGSTPWKIRGTQDLGGLVKMTFRFNSVMFRFVNNSPETPNSSPLIYKGRNLKRGKASSSNRWFSGGELLVSGRGRGDSMYSWVGIVLYIYIHTYISKPNGRMDHIFWGAKPDGMQEVFNIKKRGGGFRGKPSRLTAKNGAFQ